MLIALEWIPWGGKTTLINNYIKYHAWQNVWLHKPFLRTEVLDYCDKYVQHDEKLLEKEMKNLVSFLKIDELVELRDKCEIVFLDRFIESLWGIIYAYMYPILSERKVYNLLQKFISIHLEYKIVYIDVDIRTGMTRFKQRKWHGYPVTLYPFFNNMIKYIAWLEHSWVKNIIHINWKESEISVLKNMEKYCFN